MLRATICYHFLVCKQLCLLCAPKFARMSERMGERTVARMGTACLQVQLMRIPTTLDRVARNHLHCFLVCKQLCARCAPKNSRE